MRTVLRMLAAVLATAGLIFSLNTVVWTQQSSTAPSLSVSGSNAAASATGAAVPSSAGYTGINIGGNLTGLTGVSVGSARAAAMAIVDGSGNQITSFGGGTQYAEDSVHSSGDTLTLAGVVQQTADSALAGDGDRTLLQVDSNGFLKVNIKAGAGSGGTAMADNSAFTFGTTSGTPAMAVFDDVATNAATENRAATLRMSGNRSLYTLIGDGAGNERRANVNASNELLVSLSTIGAAGALADNTANPTVGAIATYNMCFDGSTWDRCQSSTVTEAAHDAALTPSSTIGTMAMGRASAAAPTDVSADNDAVLPWYLRSGAVASQPTFAGVLAVANSGNVGTGVQRVVLATDQPAMVGLGIYTEDAGETAGGNLSMAGSVRRDTLASSAGTTGDNATINTNAIGALWTSDYDPCSSEAKTTAPFSLTARGVVIAASASKKNYICSIAVVAGAAEIFNIVEGTGTTCQTSTAAVVGSTTAANGLSFAANGGFTATGGNASAIAGIGTNVDTCIVPSGSNRLAGYVTYVQR